MLCLKKKNPSVQCHVMKKPTVIHGFPPTQKKCSQEIFPGASLMAQMVKNLPAMQDTGVQSLGGEDPLGEGNGNPLQYSCLQNPMDRGAWWATVRRVTKSQTQLCD